MVTQGILLFGAVIHIFVSAAGEEKGPSALRCACVGAAKTGESLRGARQAKAEIADVTFLSLQVLPRTGETAWSGIFY